MKTNQPIDTTYHDNLIDGVSTSNNDVDPLIPPSLRFRRPTGSAGRGAGRW
jgi:hypothetical protein